MDDRWIKVISILCIAIIVMASLVIFYYPHDTEASLAEKVIIIPEDINETGWRFFIEIDGYPDVSGALSTRTVEIDKDSLHVVNFVGTFNSTDLCHEYYESIILRYSSDLCFEELDVGDGGFIIWHNNGNGTCALCFTFDQVFVCMDLISTYNGNVPWNDDDLYAEAMVLMDAQEQKIDRVIHS